MFHFDSKAEIHCSHYGDNGTITPNSFLPVVLYRQVVKLSGSYKPEMYQSLRQMVGDYGWSVDWFERNAVYRYPHYHSTAHEVLLIMGGSAALELGGRDGDQIAVEAGDAIAIPAGVQHERINRDDRTFMAAGLYVKNQRWDLLEPSPSSRQKVLENAPKVVLPKNDPFWGSGGPLMKHWG